MKRIKLKTTLRATLFFLLVVYGKEGITAPKIQSFLHEGPGVGSNGSKPLELKFMSDYFVTFKNDSDYLPIVLTVDQSQKRCMADTGKSPLTISPGARVQVKITDDNTLLLCNDGKKSLVWNGGMDANIQNNVEFLHYVAEKKTFKPDWKTEIKGTRDFVDSALCGNENCLYKPRIVDSTYIEIHLQGLKQSQSLRITTPENNEYESPRNITPSGTGTPGADVTYSIHGCASSDTQCQPQTRKVDANGVWRGDNVMLTTPGQYTLSASQSYTSDGITTQLKGATVSFSIVYTPDTKIIIESPDNNAWLSPGNISLAGKVDPVGFVSRVQCRADDMDGKRKIVGEYSGVSTNGNWSCSVKLPAGYFRTYAFPVEQTGAGKQSSSVSDIITGSPLIVSSPPDKSDVLTHFTMTGTMQAGATVSYTSDNCGSGQASTNGNTWSANVSDRVGVPATCVMKIHQTWYGVNSTEVIRNYQVNTVIITTPSKIVSRATRYTISGEGEPGNTIVVSLFDNWSVLGSTTVSPSGTWSLENAGPSSGIGDYVLSADLLTPDGTLRGHVDKSITVKALTPAVAGSDTETVEGKGQ